MTGLAQHWTEATATREELLLDVIADALPPLLRRAVAHRHVLAVLYRLRPAWRPQLTVGIDLDTMVVCAVKRNGIVVILDYPAAVAGDVDEAASSPVCTKSPFGI